MNRWLHAPQHEFDSQGTFMVTAGTLGKKLAFRDSERLDLLQRTVFEAALDADWKLQAWSFFPNHYHLIVSSSIGSPALGDVVKRVHSESARILKRLDGAEGRQVWFQYWDTGLTFQKFYLARIKYVYENPVHHGVVKVASNYPWSSAAWFERHASCAFLRTVQSFKIDASNVLDDY